MAIQSWDRGNFLPPPLSLAKPRYLHGGGFLLLKRTANPVGGPFSVSSLPARRLETGCSACSPARLHVFRTTNLPDGGVRPKTVSALLEGCFSVSFL